MSSRNEPPASRGPLADARVVDLSRPVASNMVTHVLVDLGADVIKAEHPECGDDLRRRRVDDGGEVFWKMYLRNKRSIALDIKAEGDREDLAVRQERGLRLVSR